MIAARGRAMLSASAIAASMLVLSGCDDTPDADIRPAVVVQAVPQTPVRERTPQVIAQRALPTPDNRPPLTEMAPQKPFTDPPLPPELLDDGDLVPLPSPARRR